MEDGVWRTIGGRKVFIKKGQSLSDAMKESGKFKKNESKKETPKVKSDDKKDKYLSRGEMGDLIDKWSSEGFEEGKYRSEYGKGVFHEKYASGQLTGYGGEEDDFVIEGFDLGSAPEKEALEDLNDILGEYGYKAEYLKEGTVHQDIKISKIKDSLPKEEPAYNVGEAEAYYSKQDKETIARDLEERKNRLDNNYYDDKDRAKYEGFYNEGKEYYDKTYGKGEEFKLSEADQEEYDSQRDTDHDGHKGIDETYGMTPKEWKKANDEYNAKLDAISEKERKAIDEVYNQRREGKIDNLEYLEKQQQIHDEWAREYNKELAKRYPDMMEEALDQHEYMPEVRKSIQEGINESPYRKSSYKVGDEVKYEDGVKGKVTDVPTKDRATIEWEDGEKNTYSTNHPGISKQSKGTYKASDLEEGKPYEIDMGNGIKKTAIYIGKDEDGNSSFYDGEGVSGTFGFSDKFINEKLKISDNKDDDKFIELHNQITRNNNKDADDYKAGKSKSTSSNNPINDYIREKAKKKQAINKELNPGGINSKEDYEHDLEWFEDMEKKYPTKKGLAGNEEYQAVKQDYESRYGKWNSKGNNKSNKQNSKPTYERHEASLTNPSGISLALSNLATVEGGGTAEADRYVNNLIKSNNSSPEAIAEALNKDKRIFNKNWKVEKIEDNVKRQHYNPFTNWTSTEDYDKLYTLTSTDRLGNKEILHVYAGTGEKKGSGNNNPVNDYIREKAKKKSQEKAKKK